MMLSVQTLQKHLEFFTVYIQITYYHIFPHYLIKGTIFGKKTY